MGIDNPVLLLGRELGFHRRIAQLGQCSLTTQALVVKGHGLGTVAVK